MFLNQPKKRKKRDGGDGFEKWGGYMNAKISKLEAQFNEEELSMVRKGERVSNIFQGISIFVNGYTEPSADELRCLMLEHGGVYHHYYRSGKTTHIIASSLPNAKFDQMKNLKVVKSEWITESIKAGRLLDYKNFLLQNDFPSASKKENLLLKFTNMGRYQKKETELPKTAADDGYLKEFYNNSRLHYISALGAMLKQHVQKMRENHNGVFPGRERLLQNLQNMVHDGDSLPDENIIMHIDMDCFFVSVALRNYPQLKGQPVAVTHSRGKSTSDRDVDRKFEYKFYKNKMKAKLDSKEQNSSESSDDDFIDKWAGEKSSMSEIASCSYEARKLGVRKGMYLGVALKLCPNLKTVPYDFEGYKEVSMTLYNTVAEYTLDIEAISCDELVIDCSSLISEMKIDPLKFAEALRKEIHEKTTCTSSVGIGYNKLQARLATKEAKPDGQFYLTPDKLKDFMKKLDVGDLPGVGRTISAKMRTLSIRTCEDLQGLPLSTLKKEFGGKTGETLYKNCRGDDDRKVNFSHERKSVSAEVNYGIRFNDDQETETFLKQLSEEVSKRLRDVNMTGKNITFKVMFRAKDAPVETAKFLGHGACDQINRSVALPHASNDAQVIARQVIALYHQLGVPANDLRGIGIQITKLESIKKAGKTLQTYFLNEQTRKPQEAPSTSRTVQNVYVNPPTASQIDPEVLASLPEEIRTEVMREYGLYEDKNPSADKEVDARKNLPQESAPEDESAKELFRLSLEDVRTMIKEWVAVESHPRCYDVKMLKSYLDRLVEKKQLETVSILIRGLNRLIKTRRREDHIWKVTYSEVVDALQNSMKRVYGRVLAIEET